MEQTGTMPRIKAYTYGQVSSSPLTLNDLDLLKKTQV